MRRQLVGPAVAADRDRMAAVVVRAIDQEPAHAALANFGKGDFLGSVGQAHNLPHRGEGASTEFLLRLAYSRFCRRLFGKQNCFSRNFSHPLWITVTSL